LIRAVKGTRDLLPPSTEVWNLVEEAARRVFRSYNYGEIRTPILEETQLFARGVGAETDIVTKEMYTFDDRDGAKLTLRPEATASVMRAYIEHHLDQRPGVQKLYYIGPMFRRERPQKGRYRQFFQIGAEAIGSESPFIDAEVIEMAVELLGSLHLEGAQLLLNSVGCSKCRPDFLAKLREELAKVAPKLCADCQRRAQTNPLRVLDCKVPEDQPIIDALPSILDHLCADCRQHFDDVQQNLTARGVAFQVRPRLVRGLDYYTRTTFEVVHGALGAQNSLLGGGRYDGLRRALLDPNEQRVLDNRLALVPPLAGAIQEGGQIPKELDPKIEGSGIGFSIGEDRLVMTLEEARGGEIKPALDLFIAPMGDVALRQCALLARDLRRQGLTIEIAAEGKLKRAIELANKLGARYTLILGENEMASGNYTLKNMATGEQQSISREELPSRLSRG